MARILPKGRYVQIYRGAVRGANKAAKLAAMAQAVEKLAKLGIKGIVWHGNSAELLPSNFKELHEICKKHNLVSLASFGDGDSYPTQFGKRVAAIANLPECFGVVLDMEGIWENEADDKEDAKKLGVALRADAPNALVIDQPWPVPHLHSSFPWDETASFVDVRAPQYYVNDWIASKGKERYAFCWDWFEKSWQRRNASYAQKGLVKPVIKTIQGYKWYYSHLVNCLTSNDTLIIWSDPFPDDVFMQCLEVVAKLENLGFTGPKAVEAFQAQWNKDHPTDLISVDNICGPKTVAKLGLPAPLPSS